ncbi:MAG: lysylphosphatidylglycerol synthase transmembrane domain-containing protein [Patescibacteria group bacterium]|nr:lysylphosphatidylglycerol synthase transmembrane domain-containing protein [Patescibacteria group bacterium]
MNIAVSAVAGCDRRTRPRAAPTDGHPVIKEPQRAKSRWWRGAKVAFRVVTSIALIGYLLGQTDLRQLAGTLANLHWRFFGVALASYLASQVISARRWAGLATAVGFVGRQSRFLSLYFQGMFFGLCLPSSVGGDVVKAWKLGENTRQRVLAACTVFADRATGVYALGLLAMAAIFWHQGFVSPPAAVGCILAWMAAGIGGVHLGLAVLRAFAPSLERFPKLGRVVVQLRPYHEEPSVIQRAVLFSMAIQGLNALTVLWIGWSLGLTVPAATYFVAVPAAALISALPISVGGMGVRETALTFFLVQGDASQDMAVTVGLVWLGIILISGLVGGLFYMADARAGEMPAGCIPMPQSIHEGP